MPPREPATGGPEGSPVEALPGFVPARRSLPATPAAGECEELVRRPCEPSQEMASTAIASTRFASLMGSVWNRSLAGSALASLLLSDEDPGS